MSVLWYLPKTNELEQQIKSTLQEKVKSHLNEYEIYAKTIRRMIFKAFAEYERKWIIQTLFLCGCCFYAGTLI